MHVLFSRAQKDGLKRVFVDRRRGQPYNNEETGAGKLYRQKDGCVIRRRITGDDAMKYRLCIFDLDGTILDTLEDLAGSVNAVLCCHNMPQRTMEEVRSFVGNGIGRLIERAVPQGTDKKLQNQVLEEFRRYYKEHCADKTRPYDGIELLIRQLRERGCQTAVVSNKADFAVQELCEAYFPGLFDMVVGEREGIRRKPYPDSVLEVLERLQVDKSQAVYIGDSEVDVQTAKRAEMDLIAVSWGFRGEALLREEGAERIAGRPHEVLKLLE